MVNQSNGLGRFVAGAAAGLNNVLARARNTLIEVLPGERPSWLVMELSGSYPARRRKRKLVDFQSFLGGEREKSQEELVEQIDRVLQAPWLEGVVLRFGALQIDLATAYALRNQIGRLRAGGRRVVVWSSDLNTVSYYLASAADEIVAPESANLWVNGFAYSSTFMAGALSRFGVRFEKLAIEEFKNAADEFALSEMSEPQRIQLDALLDSFESSYLEAVGTGRGKPAQEVKAWIDEPVTSAFRAQELGMIDRAAYEDQLLGEKHKTYAQAARFLPSRTRPPEAKRVAVVSLEGAIVPGKSRRTPVPLPLVGERMAGSETLVTALRTVARDPATAAVVFHVDSGGGSAIASDLIWRELKLLAERKPVVAVMGRAAASGGYYVLTHASRVIAAPTTITGSIGVLMGKIVLEEFNEKYDLNPEALKRGRFSTLTHSSHGWDDSERELVRQLNDEIYERFVDRVAQGRGLSPERVDEIGRGRIWSGADAREIGLVDELGDIELAIMRAKELAGLHADAPVQNVQAPQKLLLPTADDPSAFVRELAPLLRERALLIHPLGHPSVG